MQWYEWKTNQLISLRECSYHYSWLCSSIKAGSCLCSSIQGIFKNARRILCTLLSNHKLQLNLSRGIIKEQAAT